MAAPKFSKLVIVSKDKKDGDAFRMKKGSCTIGSDLQKCDIKIHREGVAPVHALINTDSMNRVWLKAMALVELNGVEIPLREPNELTHCDLITICGRSFRFEHASKLQDPPTTPGKVEAPVSPSSSTTRLSKQQPAPIPFALAPQTPTHDAPAPLPSSSVEKASSRASIEAGSSSLTNNAASSSQDQSNSSNPSVKQRLPIEETEIEEPSDLAAHEPPQVEADAPHPAKTISRKLSPKPTKSPKRRNTRSTPATPALTGSRATKTGNSKQDVDQSEESSNIQIEEERRAAEEDSENSGDESDDEQESQSTKHDKSDRRKSAELDRLAGTSSRFYKMWQPSGDRKSRHGRHSAERPQLPNEKAKPKPISEPERELEHDGASRKKTQTKAWRRSPQHWRAAPLVGSSTRSAPLLDEEAERERKRQLNREIRKASMALEASASKRTKIVETE